MTIKKLLEACFYLAVGIVFLAMMALGFLSVFNGV